MLYSKELVSDVNRCHFHPVGYDVPELFVKEIQDFSDYSFRIFKLFFYSELTRNSRHWLGVLETLT